MAFKHLNLDRSKISDAIKGCTGLDKDPKFVKKGTEHHLMLSSDGKKVLIVFYFNNDGTTTIDPTRGKHPELSLTIAKCVKEKCLVTKRQVFSLSFPDVDEETFLLLRQYLEEELGVETLKEDDVEGKKMWRIRSPFKDEITITYYGNRTVLVQGKPLFLYTQIKLFFYEILSFEQVVQKEAETYEIEINTEEIRKELKAYLPTVYKFLDDKIIRILTPSITLVKLEIDMEDYSAFVFPALRGLEGYIRQLLNAKGKDDGVRKVNKIGTLFEDPDEKGRCALMEFAKGDIACEKTCFALEEAYSQWVSFRHPYFHVEKVIKTTPIIWKKEGAEGLLFDVLKTIEGTYSPIPWS